MRGAEVEGIVGCSSRSKILRHRTLRAGVTSKAHLARQNFLREVHGCRDMVDGKDPAGAGNVPEELVVVLEKAELAARGIGDAITLKAGGHKRPPKPAIQRAVPPLQTSGTTHSSRIPTAEPGWAFSHSAARFSDTAS